MPNAKNFNYYTAHDFHSNQDIIECYNGKNSFSVLNCNIRSLSANFDNFVNMLSELHYPFSFIGLTETKIKSGHDPVMNCELPGYRFVSQPSYSNAGGVGFLIRNEFECNQRIDLSLVKNEFEILWIEVQNDDQSNMLCGIVYRHLSGGVNIFQDYMNNIIDKIHRKNKYCIILGDFNLDFLYFESHPPMDEFMTSLSTSSFQPYVLQPT